MKKQYSRRGKVAGAGARSYPIAPNLNEILVPGWNLWENCILYL